THTERRERRKQRGRGVEQGRAVSENMPWRAVSRRASAPQEDSDSLFFKSLLEDFRSLSVRTRQDLKFQIHKLVYEAKCMEAGHWGESNGVQLTSL
ncbi:hypothetical protein ABG768_013308, partial [Culter alburnus]